MFKRMSILVRRPGDERAYFARKWLAHGDMVSALPNLRAYIQNHVEEEFSPASPVRVDGFVELIFDSPEAMQQAFASSAAQPLVDDEPSFLGHGSGYALAAAPPLRPAHAPGAKLVVVALAEGRSGLDALEADARRLGGCVEVVRDDVAALIAKPGMAGPQAVDAFLHLYFNDAEAAREAAGRLAEPAGVRLGVYRVRTDTIV